MSAETPTSTEEKKPETLFIRCSVVVIYIFLAASVLNLIVFVAFLIDREWGLLNGAIVSLPAFSNRHWFDYLFPLFWGTLLLLAWWIFHTFCYICGKYDQVADKYHELEWGEELGTFLSDMCKFTIFPLSFAWFGFFLINAFYLLAKGGVWIWHLIF